MGFVYPEKTKLVNMANGGAWSEILPEQSMGLAYAAVLKGYS